MCVCVYRVNPEPNSCLVSGLAVGWTTIPRRASMPPQRRIYIYI